MFKLIGFAFGLALIGTASAQVPPPPSPPPGQRVWQPPPGMPATTQECFGGNWQTFQLVTNQGVFKFKNQGDCVSYVATQGKNLPALQMQKPPPPPPP